MIGRKHVFAELAAATCSLQLPAASTPKPLIVTMAVERAPVLVHHDNLSVKRSHRSCILKSKVSPDRLARQTQADAVV